ncbi:MAG: ATP-binding protein [Bacteroidetes bacterium]|nr:ATP-binding protein [Bacteroidota bacterium]
MKELKIQELESQITELENKYTRALKDLDKARIIAYDAERTKTIFLANMSHEIRTPMNSIIGIYNILDQTNLSPEQRELLEVINISSHNLLAIINDILDFSKIKAGQLKLESKPFLLHEEIHQIIKMLFLRAKGKGVELSYRIQSSVPECIIGDAVRLHQILVNLTNNALKFTIEGSVVVSVEILDASRLDDLRLTEYLPDSILTMQSLPPGHVLLKFEVSDTGVGIPEEEQPNLFKEYAQLDSPLIKQFEGTGLGLSISKNLIDLMNGKIGVISKKDSGSTFWFTLLYAVGDIEAFRNNIKQEQKVIKKSRPLNILLVEDNILNQKFAATTLGRSGHHVEIAENGKIAFEKFRETQYDLIIMDIAMPIMDGIESTHVIRNYEKEQMKKDPASAKPPVKIIAVTAHVIMTDREKCLSAGMDEYLAKPYRPKELSDVIDSLAIQ